MSRFIGSEPGFFAAQRALLADAETRSFGVAESWVAPVAIYDAAQGFGEEAWLEETTGTVISWVIDGPPVRCEWGSARGTFVDPKVGITLQPRGVPNHFIAAGPIRFAQLLIGDDLLRRVADAIGSDCRQADNLREDLIDFRDASLRRALMAYSWRATRARPSATCVEMEARALLIVERLLARHHQWQEKGRSSTGLAGWALKRACAYFEAHLAENIGLERVAAETGLSAFHFARAFKVSMGMPPHAYQLGLRLREARRLLEHTDMSVRGIAQAVGYADQGALTRLFQRELGTTPSRYRCERRA